MSSFIITPWEAAELLEAVLNKYFTKNGDKSKLRDISIDSPNFVNSISKYACKLTGEIGAELRAMKGIVVKMGNNSPYSKLSYTIGQNLFKGIITYLNDDQLGVLLEYTGKEKEEYHFRGDFKPEVIFRKKFRKTNWLLYTWDYTIDEAGNTIGGIRCSVLKLTDMFRAVLDIYRNREEGIIDGELKQGVFISYKGFFRMIKKEYLKIHFFPTNGNFDVEDTEDDLSFLFKVGESNATLALGQYRSIDCGNILSGTAIIVKQADNTDTKSLKPSFFVGFDNKNIESIH